jgi:hypothetical protein
VPIGGISLLPPPVPRSLSVPRLVSGATPFRSCSHARRSVPGAEVEPSLAVDPRRPASLIGVWQQDRNVFGGARGIVAAWSADAGLTWTASIPPSLTACTGGPYLLASDPIVSIGPGRAYLASLAIRRDRRTTDVVVSTSADGGRTWGRPALVRAGDFVRGDPDKETVLADPAHPGTAYAAWVEFPRQRPGARVINRAFVSRTTDGGRSWSTPTLVYGARTQTQFHQLGLLRDGTLLDAFAEIRPFPRRQHDPAVVRVAVTLSTDDGATWSTATTATEYTLTGVADPTNSKRIRADSVDFAFAASPTGHLYVAWVQDLARHPARLLVSRSDDRGLTWSPPSVVVSQPAAVFLPALAIAGDGRVGILWYSLEAPEQGHRLLTDVWLSTSRDLGRTWVGANVDGPFDLHTAPLSVDGAFVGDYQGLAGTPGGFAMLFVVAKPLASNGPTDVFFSTSR